jgi:hypothetical protein
MVRFANAAMIWVVPTLAAGLAGATDTRAQTSPVGQQGCVSYLNQTVCSPAGGAIMEHLGQALCGHGQCINELGQIICSRQAGGSVVKDNWGQVSCTGGCESASPSYCQRRR